jgi:hypothetical protein
MKARMFMIICLLPFGTYDRGANQAMVVTIIDGRIKSIVRQN